MDPRWLFPALAVLFVVLALGQRLRRGGHSNGAARTWLLLALIFGAVAAWLNFGGQNG